jgi:hypothetical protein
MKCLMVIQPTGKCVLPTPHPGSRNYMQSHKKMV